MGYIVETLNHLVMYHLKLLVHYKSMVFVLELVNQGKLLVVVIQFSLFTHHNGWRFSCEVNPVKLFIL